MITDPDVFVAWELDNIDSSEFEDTDDPRPLYVARLYYTDVVVESLSGVDAGPCDPYRDTVEEELYAEFEARRESMIERGTQ